MRPGASWNSKSAPCPDMAPSAGRRRPRAVVVRALAEIPAALLVLAEVVVLFTGVMARYVFHAPLVWTDELASILFLWLAMLGSVDRVAAGEHMRLTAVVGGNVRRPGARGPRRWPRPRSRCSC